MRRQGAGNSAGKAGIGGQRAERFFVGRVPEGSEDFELPPEEASHAAGSRRLAEGDLITLFDGSGWDVGGRIVAAGGRRVVVRPLTRVRVGAPLPIAVICATAVPKGAREDVLVSKCAELGVGRLAPLEFERSVVRPAVHWENRLARYRRLAVEAAKQSGASVLMDFGEPERFEEFIEHEREGLKLVGDPGGGEGIIDALESEGEAPAVTYIVGPEGGLTEEELRGAVAAGWRPVRIGATTLRIETAATAFASVVAAYVGRERRGK